MTDTDEPSKEFLKGFNHGYQMAKHEPELLNKLLQAQSSDMPTDYAKAMQQGKDQHQREVIMTEMKAIRDRQKRTMRRRS